MMIILQKKKILYKSSKNDIIKFIKLIEIDINVKNDVYSNYPEFKVLKDGRIGGHNGTKFIIYNRKNYSIQMQIKFDRPLDSFIQMKNGTFNNLFF